MVDVYVEFLVGMNRASVGWVSMLLTQPHKKVMIVIVNSKIGLLSSFSTIGYRVEIRVPVFSMLHELSRVMTLVCRVERKLIEKKII